jgi:hypothetical protein
VWVPISSTNTSRPGLMRQTVASLTLTPDTLQTGTGLSGSG